MENHGANDIDCVVTSADAGAAGGCQGSGVSELNFLAVSCAIPAGHNLPVSDSILWSLRSSDGAEALYVSLKTNGNVACGLHAPFGSLRNNELQLDDGRRLAAEALRRYKAASWHGQYFRLAVLPAIWSELARPAAIATIRGGDQASPESPQRITRVVSGAGKNSHLFYTLLWKIKASNFE